MRSILSQLLLAAIGVEALFIDAKGWKKFTDGSDLTHFVTRPEIKAPRYMVAKHHPETKTHSCAIVDDNRCRWIHCHFTVQSVAVVVACKCAGPMENAAFVIVVVVVVFAAHGELTLLLAAR